MKRTIFIAAAFAAACSTPATSSIDAAHRDAETTAHEDATAHAPDDASVPPDAGAHVDEDAAAAPDADPPDPEDASVPPAEAVTISIAPGDELANNRSHTPSLSGDGRFVAFLSYATNLVAEDHNAKVDLFLRDTCMGASGGCTANTTRVSIATDGTEADNETTSGVLAAEGRYIAFASAATNLVPTDTNAASDVFLRDTCFGAPAACTSATTRVSLTSDGAEASGSSTKPAITPEGRYVAFVSSADNIVDGDTNAASDVFIRDTCLGAPAACTPATTLVSLDASGAQFSDESAEVVLSADGRYVAWTAVLSSGSGTRVFARDTCLGALSACTPATIELSAAPAGARAAPTASSGPSMSADGRFVAFMSSANDLVPDDTNAFMDVFLYDTCFGQAPACTPSITRTSVNAAGTGGWGWMANISADGRYVGFASPASDLMPAGNGEDTVYVRDTCFGTVGCTPSTVRVPLSIAATGERPSLSRDGTWMAFDSFSLALPNSSGGQVFRVRAR